LTPRLHETECAPGFAGRGNQGICRPCPAGTQIALGGSVLRSTCLNCPEGTVWSDDGTKCLCPAGTQHVAGPVSTVQLAEYNSPHPVCESGFSHLSYHTQCTHNPTSAAGQWHFAWLNTDVCLVVAAMKRKIFSITRNAHIPLKLKDCPASMPAANQQASVD